jgi:hypothetical protein
MIAWFSNPEAGTRAKRSDCKIAAMPSARCSALALLILTACGASVPEDPAPLRADPAALMEHAAVEPDASQSAEPRRRPTSKTEPAPPSEPASAYDRKLWPHWIDADHDCQDARVEVLIAEAYEPVEFEDTRRCEVARGRWQCPYTGDLIAEAYLLDVDHLVPLANAHRSGAASWTEAERRRYANDLEHPEHLVAVEHTANRSKGDKGPEAWLPPMEDARCGYVRDWVTIKERWGLSKSDAEAAAIANALEICAAGQVPPLPQVRTHEKVSKPDSQTKHRTDKTCCRTCTKGKACGDSCIAKTSTCTKPPGCACDG